MKTIVSGKKQESGNVLLVSIGITTVAAFTLASFLTLTAGQNTAVARSQSWNATIPVIEAGIEEAMTHLNDNCTYTDIQHPSTNWGADGWTSTDIGYEKMTSLPSGSYYHVEIITAFPYSPFEPAVVSEGHVQSPFGAALSAPLPFIASITPTVDSTSVLATNVVRKVRVTAGRHGIFAKGLVAKDTIDLNGNNITTDSFDSSDPSFSSNGQYDPTKHKDNGDVATDSSIINTLNVGNANIYGHVSTGPGGQVAIGSNGKVGDSSWLASGTTTGIQPGHFSDDMNVYFPDVQAPFNGGWSTPAGPLVLTNAVQQYAIGTNTSTTYPSGKTGAVITNTVTVTTPDFPAAGTYIGVPNMNTASTTTTTFPADGTYVGVVVTNTQNTTAATYPAAGTYIGAPITNTAAVTTTTYPDPGTYVNSVTTNTVTTNSPTYPTSNFIGTVSTNTSPTNSLTYPAPGTYLGSITTNNITTNSSTFPAGGTNVVTNTVLITSATYPADGTYMPPVATNTTPTTTTTYPTAGSYTGNVMTNTTSTTSSTYPTSGSYTGTVTTNSSPITTTSFPSAGTYVGNVTTNTSSKTTGSFPSPGTYVGSITTNTTWTTSDQYPGTGTYVGSITTNTQSKTTSSYPAPGTFVGNITTNCSSTLQSQKDFPAPGTYCGTPVQTGNSTNNSSAWNFYPISSYTYVGVVSYSFYKVSSYTYQGVDNFTYNHINGYTYNLVSGYSYNLITGYTYAKISSYSYVAGISYGYLTITGYSYLTISGYSYDLITGYTFQQISSYTYMAITGWTWAQIVSYTWVDYAETTTNMVIKYDWVLDDGNYELSSFGGTVLVRGHATLYVTDSVQFTGTDSLTINPGATLKLYVGAKNATLGGQGVWNATGNATNFSYYGLPSNESVAISGNGQITGVIYAPEAQLQLNGGGNNTTDFIGASVTKTAQLNGHFNFHYDEDLNKHGPAAAYKIESWNEIPITQRY